jgi:tetratricopeptide (TPR) repeat protein
VQIRGPSGVVRFETCCLVTWLATRECLGLWGRFHAPRGFGQLKPEATVQDSTSRIFVGRGREVVELSSSLDDAIAGRGRLFLISGEPGIGKTWLADEVARHAAERGLRVAWGRCWEGGGAPAYWPWVQVLRSLVVHADRTRVRPPLVTPEIGQLIPELSSETNRPSSSDPDKARFRLFDGVATMLKDAARTQPLILIFDDLHEADQDSLEMLKFVARGLRDSQIVVIGNYRDVEVRRSQMLSEAIAELLHDGDQIPLAGLAESEVARMVETRAALAPSASFVADLHRATAGNPLFVDGVVRVLIAEGKLAGAERLDLSGFKLPEGSRGAIHKRLAMLSADAQALLSVAAVIGQEFESGLLKRVSDLKVERLPDLLEEAVAAGLIVPLDGSRHRFTHPLIREALYNESVAAERIALHRRIGDALEQIHTADLSHHLAELAHHYRQSRDLDKAIGYLVRAGDSAAAKFALREAESCWEDALHLFEAEGGDPARHADLLVRAAILRFGREEQTVERLEQALAIYEKLEVRAKTVDLHIRLLEIFANNLVLMDHDRAGAHFRKAESLLVELPASESLADLYHHWAWLCIWRARIPPALEAAERSVELANQLNSPAMAARAEIVMGACMVGRGRLREGFERLERGWQQADAINDLIAGATVNAQFHLLNLGDQKDAMRWLVREISRPRNAESAFNESLYHPAQVSAFGAMGELGDVRRMMSEASNSESSYTVTGVGQHWLSFWDGNLEEAAAGPDAFIGIARHQGRAENVCNVGANVSQLYRLAGHYAKAEELLREGLSYSVPGGYIAMEIMGRECLAHVLADTGRTDEAKRELARCREIMAAGEDWRGFAGLVEWSEAAIAVAEKRFDDADHHFALAIEIIRRHSWRTHEGPALCEWGCALLAAGHRDRALEKFDEAIELFRRVGVGQRWFDYVEAARQPARSDKTSVAGQLRKEGTYWTVSFGGETFRLKDSKSLRVIAHLIRNPGHRFHARELAALDSPNQPVAQHFDERVGATVSSDLGDAGVVLDARAVAEYRRRLEDLRPELEEAERCNDLGRVSLLREEAEVLTAELAAGVGFQGRERRISSHSERARLSVFKNIRGAIEKIREANPALGRHLANSIKTGFVCSYSPDPANPVVWRS